MSTEQFMHALTADHVCTSDVFVTGIVSLNIAHCYSSTRVRSSNPDVLTFEYDWQATCSIYIADIGVYIYKGFDFLTIGEARVGTDGNLCEKRELLALYFLDSSGDRMLQWERS